MLERSWPLPTLQQLRRLTDDCGVIQHAKFWLPDYATGYCVDDNSRAMIVAHHFYKIFGDEVAHDLLVRYLSFIFFVQREDGKIRNFVSYGRSYLEDEGSPDSLGRTIWGLGRISTMEEEYLTIPAREMFHRALAHLTPHHPPHTQAYGILGLCAYGELDEKREEAGTLARPMARALLDHYMANQSDDWHWFLPLLTYANGRLPEALLRAGLLLESPDMIDAGLQGLDFLNGVSYRDGYLSVVGCHGWYPKGGRCAVFDQQPIDAGAMVEVNLVAHRLTGNADYFDYAVRAMDWFYGRNVLQVPMYNDQSGGCHDGLHSQGINANQGAESTLVYLMAQLSLYQEAPHLFAMEIPDSMPQVEEDRVRDQW